ncbi:AraC family transcriptional regulator [Belliella sp. R4-6]|uniref:AraC family transcriptional regulator n=1 Tax=Belliella alkalica TaxID=1730871 RepID=A0ABS9VD40_9BACT|nr:AraC family transcriptional regulator [Belliella alkalica]MCH7414365.1 AraC family transcriptional regulator [Belliella alkalica]
METNFKFPVKSQESETPVLKNGFKGEKINIIPRKTLHNYFKGSRNRNLYLTDIGYFPLASNHQRQRDKGCGEYILIYCVEGKGIISLNNISNEIIPNSFFVIPKNVPHSYYSNPKDPWSIYWVHFNGNYGSEIFRKFNKLNNFRPVKIPFEQSRINEFNEIIDLLSYGYNDEIFEYSSLLLHKFLGSFIFYTITSEKKMNTKNDDLVKEIINFLKENINNTLTIDMITNRFNKSTTSIFNIFKAKTGYSIIHYTNLLKIQHACELLNLTEMSIKEISYSLNFQDPLYFSRLFKKYMSISPKEYKKNR